MSENFSKAILERDFPMDGVHLVAASAGTGKTYSLQNVYARLVFEHGMRPDEILVVTFTKAATAELRDRLRRILSDLVLVIRRRGEFDANGRKRYQQALALYDGLIKSDEKSETVALARLERAVAEADASEISTIHGFCQRVLKRHAFESGFSLAAEISGDTSPEIECMANDWWRTHFEELGQVGLTRFPDFKRYVDFVAKNPDAEIYAGDMDTKQHPMSAAGFGAARKIVATYETGRADRLELTYDDLLRGVKDALHGQMHDALVSAIRGEYKAALIDEFQDTDGVQYEIFREFFINGASIPVFFVGDVKQAIYAFRGGDVHTYCEAFRNVPEERRYDLAVNYRSAKKVVESVNRMFADDNDGGEYTFGSQEAKYSPIGAAGKPLILKGEAEENRPFAFVEVPKESQANVAVGKVIELLNSAKLQPDGEKDYRQLRPKDIAVLCVRNDDCDLIKRRLIAKGVRAVGKGRDSITASGEARLIYMIVKAMVQPSGVGNLRALLVSPFCGRQIDGVEDAKKLGDEAKLFLDARAIWGRSGFVSALTYLREQYEFDARMSGEPDGERRLTNFEQMAELVNKKIQTCNLAESETLQWISDVITGRVALGEDESLLRLDSDEDAVSVMTLHRSKGLEFPVVIIPMLKNGPTDVWSANGEFNGSMKQFGFALASYYADGRRHLFNREENSKDTAPAKASDKEDREEFVRQLYVAFTRASRHCEVIVESGLGDDSVLGKLLLRVKERNDDELIGFDEIIDPPPFEKIAPWKDPLRRKPEGLSVGERCGFAPTWDHGSYSSLSPTGSVEPREETDQRSEHALFCLFRSDDKTGTGWHELFEKISFQASHADRLAQTEVILWRNGLLKPGMDDESEKLRNAAKVAATEMVEKVLELPLSVSADDRTKGTFRLAEIPDADRRTEWEFEYHPCGGAIDTTAIRDVLLRHWPDRKPFLEMTENWSRKLPTGWMTGFIDLLFRRDGRYYVVDWKSNSLGGIEAAFTARGIEEEMASHGYFLQYLLYATVLHVYLQDALGANYEYDRNFGGIAYVFLRGAVVAKDIPDGAIFEDRPPQALLDDLAKVFGLTGKEA